MPEETPQPPQQNVPPPPPPRPQVPPAPPPAQDEAALRAELERARSRNKLLKIAASVLAVLFIVVASAAFYIYRKISQTTEALEEAFRTPQPLVYGSEGGQLPRTGFGVAASTGMPASSLGMFSGSLGGGEQGQPGGISEAQAAGAVNALSKYADRPIVKEFLADLKRDPDGAKAMANAKGGNPMSMLAAMRGSKSLEKMMAKYATRPEFLALMMEVMRDPAVKPFMSAVPGGLPPELPQAPGAARPQTGPQAVPAASAGEGAGENAAEEEGPMMLDTSAISGTSSEAPAPARKGGVPPPVDSQ